MLLATESVWQHWMMPKQTPGVGVGVGVGVAFEGVGSLFLLPTPGAAATRLRMVTRMKMMRVKFMANGECNER